ncbi:MAG TPA: glycosyltransferase family 87 protein [Patescibacteria group bacterium]|nr:glycosyltransferase family 87 protein [Patescibacteria group bacterium]
MGEIPPIHFYVLAILLIHTVGNFGYMGLWRNLTAADFDVNDFKAYYTSATAVRTGQAGQFLYSDPARMNLGLLPDQPWVEFATSHGVPHPSAYIYPPFLAVALAPLTLLPYHEANLLWFGLNTLLLAASIVLLLSLGRQLLGRLDPLACAAVIFVCLNFFPTVRAMQCGQAGFVLLFLTAGGLIALVRRRDPLAGLCLALAAAIKLTPLLLIVWLAWAGRRRAAAWGAALFAGFTACSLAVVGWSNGLLYVTGFLPVLSRGAATYANQSINGFLNRMLTDQSMAVFGFSDEPGSVWLLTRLFAGLLLGAAFALTRPGWLGRPTADLLGEAERRTQLLASGYALVTLSSLLVSPISWEHHYVLALVPLSVMIFLVADRGAIGSLALLSIAYVAISIDAFELVRKELPRGARPAMSYLLYGGLLLWGLIAAQMRRRRTPA